MKVGVVCDPFVALGFQLAGLSPAVASDPETARRLLSTMLDDQESEWGLILLQEGLLGEPASAAPVQHHGELPLLIPFPGPELEQEPAEAERYVSELLRQAIGYRVKLR